MPRPGSAPLCRRVINGCEYAPHQPARPPLARHAQLFHFVLQTIKIFGIQFMGNASLGSQTVRTAKKSISALCSSFLFPPFLCCKFLTLFLKEKRALIACLILKLSCSRGGEGELRKWSLATRLANYPHLVTSLNF